MDDLTALLSGSSLAASSPSGDKPLSNYELFLEALLKGQHPSFCELVWNGEIFQIVLQLHFQKTPEAACIPNRQSEVFRREAWRHFSRLTPTQQRMMDIRIHIKNWLPVTAEVTLKPEASSNFRFDPSSLHNRQNP